MPRTQIGGSFAPPLSDEKIKQYTDLIATLPDKTQVKDCLLKLLKCCTEWWNQPESTGQGKPHPSGRGFIVDLDQPIQDALFDSIPWMEELDIMSNAQGTGVFDALTGDVRHMAFHLLWHAKELCLDREPMTSDKL